MSSTSKLPLQKRAAPVEKPLWASLSQSNPVFQCWLLQDLRWLPCHPHSQGQGGLLAFPPRHAEQTGTSVRASRREVSTMGRTMSQGRRTLFPKAIPAMPLLPSAAASPGREEIPAYHPQGCQRLSWAKSIYLLLLLLNLTCSGGENSVFRIAGY